jgi:hypothetical protein
MVTFGAVNTAPCLITSIAPSPSPSNLRNRNKKYRSKMKALNELQIKLVGADPMPLIKIGNCPAMWAITHALMNALAEMQEEGQLTEPILHQLHGVLFCRGKLHEHYEAIVAEVRRQNP